VCSICRLDPIRMGVLTDEPISRQGFTSIFEEQPGKGCSQLLPVFGQLEELLSDAELRFLIVDLHQLSTALEVMKTIRYQRPGMRLVVIGPEGDDKLVMKSILAGARAYLDCNADTHMVRQALEAVISGSIWAPRRLLSKLIDHLLGASDTSLTNAAPPHLTDRERQVLDLILLARSNREIATQLGIEERTVKAHVGRLMRKTGTNNRIDLSMRALDHSLLTGTAFHGSRQGEHRQVLAFNQPPSVRPSAEEIT
jgi:DNA-binding NarL/FixJ family response regulator